ncbi:MAG TPA: hypothetical protein VLN49_11710 [Gemmatimonadaceae bacterium]|nr:hypothetical protein [Gemmatimonadaceae bacterium]
MTRLFVAALATGTVLAASQATGPRSRQIESPSEVHDTTPATPTAPDPVPTEVTMRNIDFHVGDGVVLHIRRLRGFMRGRNGVVDFDDVSSYTVDVSAAEVGLAGDDLTNLLNRYVFAYPGAPLSKLHVRVGADGLRQNGILHKGVDIPFDMTSNVSLTSDGRIRLHAAHVKIFGVNGLALMGALGLSLEKMIDLSRAHGITAKGNDLFLDATALLPPPKISGKITAVRIDGDQLVQTFGNPSDSTTPTQSLDPDATNFMLYRGGTLHFTKLLMSDAEMLVVDADPRTPFDFDNPGYRKQLVAGRSRTLPDMGLEVWMPDAGSLGKPTP